MIILIDQFEYIGHLADTAGVRVLIDSQKAMPFPEDLGVSVSPGLETSVGIKMVLQSYYLNVVLFSKTLVTRDVVKVDSVPIMTESYRKPQGLYSLRRRRLISIGIPIINLRRSSDRLRFIMGIPIPVRRRLLSE